MVKDLRPALREFLLADGAISAIVGTRVYPNRMPQGNKAAAIVYTRVSGDSDYHMEGPSGYARPRVQIAAWAGSGDASDSLARAIKARLDGYTGEMGTGANKIDVQGVFEADFREQYDDEVALHGVTRDWFIHYEEL